jgi:L-malate glycosyltransferase
MKILIVGSNSIHVSSFIRSLAEKEQNIYLLAEEKCDFFAILEEKNISFRSLNPITLFSSYYKLKKYIQQLNPTIIHIHQLNRLAFFVTRVARNNSIPIISTAWGSDVLLIPFKNKFFYYLTKKTLETSRIVTADAQSMIDVMQKICVSSTKYELLQYGIDLVDSGQKEEIIYSNRLHKPFYRIDKIIDYFAEFSKDYPSWKLIIGGEGDETEALKKQVNNLKLNNCVEFVGWLNAEENNKWYTKSSIYISIPESDGTSVSVLEAMSGGCIPVLSDLAVTHEWIRDKENGIIEKKGQNPLFKALEINQQTCSEINRKLVQEKASREMCTEKFVRLYQQLIK